MLTLNKTHRLGGSYEPYTKVELFQLAKLKLHWYLQYVARNPPAGEALGQIQDTVEAVFRASQCSPPAKFLCTLEWLGSCSPPVLLGLFCDSRSSLTQCE